MGRRGRQATRSRLYVGFVGESSVALWTLCADANLGRHSAEHTAPGIP